MCRHCDHEEQHGMPRRDFVKIMGVSVASVSFQAAGIAGAASMPGPAASNSRDHNHPRRLPLSTHPGVGEKGILQLAGIGFRR